MQLQLGPSWLSCIAFELVTSLAAVSHAIARPSSRVVGSRTIGGMTALSRLGLASGALKPACCSQWSVRFTSDFPLTERRIDIVTCRHLYPKHRDKGINFEIKYVDERPTDAVFVADGGGQRRNSGRQPVVLMLHGSPGSYTDFKFQIECLAGRGARVLAPNFPDLPTIRKYRYPTFRNTPLNKASLIRDFLKALDIPKIDMLVTHSSGTYAGLRLFRAAEKLDIDAFAMLNPAGHWHTCTNPRWFYQPLGELVHWRLGYALCNAIGMRIFPLLGPVDVPNIDGPLLALNAIRSFNLKEVEVGLRDVESRRPFLLFTFSENDKVIGRHVSYDMLRILEVEEKDWWFFDSLGKLKSKGKETDWVKAISFQSGSHYSLRKHPDITNVALLQLFNKLPIAKTLLDQTELKQQLESRQLEYQKLEQEKLEQEQLKRMRKEDQLHEDKFPDKQLKVRM